MSIPAVSVEETLDFALVNRDAGPRFQRCACSCESCASSRCGQWLDVTAPPERLNVARVGGDAKHDVGGSMWRGELCGSCTWERVLAGVRRWFR